MITTPQASIGMVTLAGVVVVTPSFRPACLHAIEMQYRMSDQKTPVMN
jgi:hypothetical protein